MLSYAMFGPGLWLALGCGMMAARVRMSRLSWSRAKLPAKPPKLAIVIPARNEGRYIGRCMESILTQAYPGGEFVVVAVNDRSTDNTGAELDAVAARDPRLLVLHLTEKPDDWLGKCHALHRGVEAVPANTEWILFIDSDVSLNDNALSRTMALTLERGIDAVSALTRQRCETVWEKLCTPVACAAIVAMYLASLTNVDRWRNTAFANGQFFLIRRSAYLKVGGHEVVRHWPCEDIELMRLLKQHDFKCRLYSGEDLAETRFYDSVTRMFEGWGRIYSGASGRRPYRILAAMVFVASGAAAFFALPWALAEAYASGGGWNLWTSLAAVHLAAVLACLAAVYRWSGNAMWYGVFFPFTAVMQTAFFVYALWWCLTNKMIWRGTAYSTPTGRA